MVDLGIILLSHGDERYARQSINLARSIRMHNPNLPLAIVADRNWSCFARAFDHVIIHAFESYSGVMGKLLMYDLSPFARTLYLDSDMLVFGSLEPVFHCFAGHEFAVIDEPMRPNRWFRRMRVVREAIPHAGMLAFAGAAYYWERSAAAERVFRRARFWRDRYDELQILRYRDQENEEALFALAMFEDGIRPMPTDAYGMCLSLLWPNGWYVEQDVIAGRCLVHHPGAPQRRPWMHYYAGAVNSYSYIREALRLKMQSESGSAWSESRVRVVAYLRWLAAPPHGLRKFAQPAIGRLQRIIRRGNSSGLS